MAAPAPAPALALNSQDVINNFWKTSLGNGSTIIKRKRPSMHSTPLHLILTMGSALRPSCKPLHPDGSETRPQGYCKGAMHHRILPCRSQGM